MNEDLIGKIISSLEWENPAFKDEKLSATERINELTAKINSLNSELMKTRKALAQALEYAEKIAKRYDELTENTDVDSTTQTRMR